MLDDDDDKLDTTPEDAGEGSGEDSDKESEDIFAEHELDITSPDDLEAMEDITFGESLGETPLAPEDDAMAVFDEFTITDDTPGDADQAPEAPIATEETLEEELSFETLETPSEGTEQPEEELFSDIFEEDLGAVENEHPKEESLLDEQSLGYNEDNTATEILEGLPQTPEFEPEPEPEPAFEPEMTAAASGVAQEAAAFETDAFDDINSEQLFDYDPNAAADASSSDDMFATMGDEADDLTSLEDTTTAQGKMTGLVAKLAETGQGILFGIIEKLPPKVRDFLPVKSSSPAPAMAGGGGEGGDGGEGGGGGRGLTFKQRRLIRMFAMIFMVMLVYSLLRSCTGGRTDTDMQGSVLDAGDTVATVTERDEVPFDEEDITQPDAISMADLEGIGFDDDEPDLSFEEEPQQEVEVLDIEITAGPVVDMEALDDIQAATDQLEMDLAAVRELQNLGLMIPQGMSGLALDLPIDPDAVYTRAPGQEDQVTGKLSDLEASLMAIDDRLDELNFQMRDERITRLENVLGDRGTPQTQAILIQALEKMEDIDQKLSRLNDLQKEMRSLDLEMKSIKSDIVQQSAIVGEQQRDINQSMAIAKMEQDVPPKIVVQATIPGRAWLRSEYGELLTVIPGDDIPGYGRVISIDASTGTVVMSSRAVFRED